ncbi:kinase-like domain-containing protein, partial [Haematococcus lacustris]
MIQQQGSERPTTSGSYKSEQDTTIRVHAVDAALLSRSSCVSQPKPTMHPHFCKRSIAQYSQKVELYRGSVSTVYKALDDVTGTKVILKCYHKKKMQAKHYNKLDREIKAMDEDSVWLAMELCEGGDLFKSLMLHGGRLDEHYVCTEIIAPLLRVLEKSHAMNIMHRDIKPENLFLTRYQKIRVGDFGLAVDWSKELPFSRSGTLDYMAPEVLRNPASQLQESSDVTLEQLQAKGIKPYDDKVDVWAVGVLAYEMVVGKPPFEVEDEAQTANLIMTSNAITSLPRTPP